MFEEVTLLFVPINPLLELRDIFYELLTLLTKVILDTNCGVYIIYSILTGYLILSLFFVIILEDISV